jgi:hypothetical protein
MGFVDLNVDLKNSPSQKKVLKFFHEIVSENTDQISKAQYDKINNLLKTENVIKISVITDPQNPKPLPQRDNQKSL